MSKPTLGYQTRTDAVVALRLQGLTKSEIAKKIGIKLTAVSALERSAAKRSLRPPEQVGRTIVLPVDVLEELQPHALRRNLTVDALAQLIIETIVDDAMVDAILDDEVLA